jgi:hypothetical protein
MNLLWNNRKIYIYYYIQLYPYSNTILYPILMTSVNTKMESIYTIVSVFDIYLTEFGADLTTVLPVFLLFHNKFIVVDDKFSDFEVDLCMCSFFNVIIFYWFKPPFL